MTFEEAINILKKLDTNCGSCTLQADCTYQKDERCLLKECYEKIIKVGELLTELDFLK